MDWFNCYEYQHVLSSSLFLVPSSRCMFRFPWSLIPPLLPTMMVTPNSHTPVSLSTSRWSFVQPCVEYYSGSAPSWGLVPTSPLGTTTPPVFPALKMFWHLWIRPLPAQNMRQLPPTLPCLLKFAYHLRKVIISRRHYLSQIFKCRHISQRSNIGLKGPLCDIPQFLLR